jgi:Rax2 C-terminal beta propeller domain
VLDISVLQLSSNHPSNSILPSDKVILLSGSILIPDFGPVSAVFFTGQSFIPYLLTSTLTGTPGLITGLFTQNTQSFSSTHHVPIGWIVVIALALSLFLILLLVIGGIVAARIRRAREGYMPAPVAPSVGEENLERVPPERLLENLEGRRAEYL